MNKANRTQVGWYGSGQLIKSEECPSGFKPAYVDVQEEPKYIHKYSNIVYVKDDYIPREGIVSNVFFVDGKYEYFVSGGDRNEIVRSYQIVIVDRDIFNDISDSIVGIEDFIHSSAIKEAFGMIFLYDTPSEAIRKSKDEIILEVTKNIKQDERWQKYLKN